MPSYVLSTDNVSDNFDMMPMTMPGVDPSSALADPSAQMNTTTDSLDPSLQNNSSPPPSAATANNHWGVDTYRKVLGTSSDLYSQGYLDRSNDDPMDENMAVLSDDYLHGFDEAGFYTENAQESAPQNIQPINEDEKDLKRNPVARTIFRGGHWGLNEPNDMLSPDKSTQEADPSEYDPNTEGDPTLRKSMPPSYEDSGVGFVSASVRNAQEVLSDNTWFKGDSQSISNRLDTLEKCIKEVRRTASHVGLDERELATLGTIASHLELEKNDLTKVASEYVDFSMQEYYQSLPGGVVAQNYASLTANSELGEDDGTFLYREAKKVVDEVQNMNWDAYVTLGARLWVLDQDEKLLQSKEATKDAALYHVFQDSLPIREASVREKVIEGFVENVEKERAQLSAANRTRKNATKTAAVAHKESITQDMEDYFGPTTLWV